jgi:prepilin-type N-terminal cleavage/methylation domain-containing protein
MLKRASGSVLQRGLSLVELMVGMAVGLLVVAGAALVTSTQISDSRRLLLETQMQQDLRAAADIITRDLRRAGSWGYTNLARDTVWSNASPAPSVNPYMGITLTGTPATEVGYSYYRKTGTVGPFGFKLEGGVIKSYITGTSWQELTDSKVMTVTGFTVTPIDGPPVKLPCPHDCPAGGTACFPTWTVRQLVVNISAQAVSDPAIVRSIRAVAKPRNDLLTPSAMSQVCPS